MIPLFLIMVLGYVEAHAHGATATAVGAWRAFFFSFSLFFFAHCKERATLLRN